MRSWRWAAMTTHSPSGDPSGLPAQGSRDFRRRARVPGPGLAGIPGESPVQPWTLVGVYDFAPVRQARIVLPGKLAALPGKLAASLR